MDAHLPAPDEDARPDRTADLWKLAQTALAAGLPATAAEADRAAERIAGGRFYVACVGQFKRGKSTLLNALIGEPILPAGVVPVTSVVTVVRYGAERGARVRFASGAWAPVPVEVLGDYVSEEQNPDNRKEVEAVEVFVPAKLLEAGLCLVDTPGVGSVFTAAGRATRSFVPQIDAALVVLGADPPISGEELALVEEVARQVETLIVVLNKSDRLSASDRHEAIAFAERVLEARLGRPIGPILELSATERLAGAGPVREWGRLVETLTDLARRSGAGLLKAAAERAISVLTTRLLRVIDEQLGALRRPIEETRKRLEALRRSTAELQRSLGDLTYLLTAEQDRLARRLRDERNQFLPQTLGAAARELRAAAPSLGDERGPRLRRHAMELAGNIASEHLDRWLEEQEPAAEKHYQESAQRFVDLANGFLARFEVARTLGLDQLPPALASETGFRVGGRLVYTELLHLTTPSWLTWLADRVRPHHRAVEASLRGASGYMERLLAANSARIQNDLIERVAGSRQRLETDIRARLTEALEGAEQALDRASRHHKAGSDAVEAEVERLETLRRCAEELLARQLGH